MSTEAEQTTILVRSLQNAGAWARKYPDLQALLAGMRRYDMLRSLPPQPCDIEACYLGRGLHIEVKYMDGYRAFSRKVFERKDGSSQLDDLHRYEAAGGIGAVALVVWQARQFSRLLLWRVGELEEEMGERGSVLKKDLLQVPYLEKYGRKTEAEWAVGPWLDRVTAEPRDQWMHNPELLADIECPGCGGVAARGMVSDGDALLCGCAGWISLDAEQPPEVLIDDDEMLLAADDDIVEVLEEADEVLP